jgi:hypothetical protein
MTTLYEVWVNGSAKFEGTREQCEAWAAKRQTDEPDAEIQIDRVEDE